MTHEELPLATLFRDLLTYLGGRTDAVLFGAQAVNAWCEPPRMTADIDLLSTNATVLAEQIREHLSSTFHIAMRVREVVPGGFRVYQLQKPKNRHLVDVRQVAELPPHRAIDGVQVALPAELVAMKVVAIAKRAGKVKAISDRLDLHRLLNAFEELRDHEGDVTKRLRADGASEAIVAMWRELASERIAPDDDEGD